MIARQNAALDVDAHFVAALPDNVAQALIHRALEDLVPILRRPHDMKPEVEPRMRG